MSVDILVPSVPKRLQITEGMTLDFLQNPVLGAKVLLKQDIDVFQAAALKIAWWTPFLIDSSGYTSSKTERMFLISVLRCLLIPDHIIGVYYPSFDTGKQVYAPKFPRLAAQSEYFRTNMGRHRVIGLDGKSGEDEKGQMKNPSHYSWSFKNGSKIIMPAPGFLQNSKTQAGQRFNDLFIDEWTKIMALKTNATAESASGGIEEQLLGRTTRENWNSNHPIFSNHHYFLATPEDMSHPASARYKVFRREVGKGDPDYALISFNYKHYSDKLTSTGASFKARFRQEKMIKQLRNSKSRTGFLQEGLGIWGGKNAKGWYTSAMVDQSKALGVRENTMVYCSRNEDPQGDKAFYFCGIDPARANEKKADDGAIVVLRAVPKTFQLVEDIRGYNLSFCYAYKVRKADAGQWSGIIHRKHQHFRFTGIMMDPLGGGLWIQPELKKVIQTIRGITQEVRPIGTLEDEQGMMVVGDFILSMFRPRDERIKKKYEHITMLKQENLTQIAHEEFREGLGVGIAFPQSPYNLPRELTSAWLPERFWAAKLLTDGKRGLGNQLTSIYYLTDELGNAKYSKGSNALSFAARGKKDFAYAAMMAYMRFLIWVQTAQDDMGIPDEDAAMCGGD